MESLPLPPSIGKECSKCRRILSTADFYIDKRTGSLYARCRKCHYELTKKDTAEKLAKSNERSKAWRLRDPEAFRASMRKSKQKNKARNLLTTKRYHERFAKKRNEYNRLYGQKNAERIKARHAARKQLYPEKHRQIKHASNARRKCRKLGNGPIERFAFIEIYERDGWVCGICGEPVDKSLEPPHPMRVQLDHILPFDKGGSHSRSNVQCSHARCNMRKKNRLIPSAFVAISISAQPIKC